MRNRDKNLKPNLPNPKIYLPMLVLMSQPNLEERMKNTISLLENLANTIRTLQKGSETMLNSIKEAEQQILSIMGHTSNPGGNNDYHTLPADRENTTGYRFFR
ncbi:MAG: hypothetical protein H0Z40_12115 [Desulfotomaculum sp.]|nr:hypothetical protein [Desulfotomaculum sp.]